MVRKTRRGLTGGVTVAGENSGTNGSYRFLLVVITVAAIFILGTFNVNAQAATPDFRISDVRSEYGHLIVEVQLFNPDGSHWHFEHFAFQGREQFKRSRVVDADGQMFLSDNSVAPTRLNIDGETVHYAPVGTTWLRETQTHLESASIISVIQQIYNQRLETGHTRGKLRLTTTPLDSDLLDRAGAPALVDRFDDLIDRAYIVDRQGRASFSGTLEPTTIPRGLEHGTVNTFYPGASAIDGSASQSTNAIWATIRNGPGEGADTAGANQQVRVNASAVTNEYDIFTRTVLLFDTATLPDGDTVSSATMDVVLVTGTTTDGYAESSSISMVTTTPASNTSLVNGDYAQFGTTKQSADKTNASFTADNSTYNLFTLNATGLGNISLTGVTKFGLRVTFDNDNTEPTWASGVGARIVIHSRNEAEPGDILPRLVVTHSAPTAAITGTIGDGATEQEVRDGGGTILVTLTDDTWVADGATFDAQRQAIIDGLDAASSPTTGWNNEVRDSIGVASVVRTNDTLATITLTASEVAGYAITGTETITVTVPAAALTGGGALTATPTIAITAVTESAAITGTIGDGATEQEVRDGGGTILVTLTNTKWVAAGATFNAERQAIIDGLDAADAQAAGWNAQVRDQLNVTSVVRTSDTLATITVAAGDVTGYAIATNEIITVTVPASAIGGSALTATPTFTITAGTESAAITGTISDGATSPQVQAGGQTAIVTLTNTKWVATGATFNAQRQNIIDGFVSASSETDGWNNRRSDFAVTDVVRTSDIIATVTFSASSAYATSAAETITLTVPATAIDGPALTATPTFVITPNYVSSGTWISPAIDLSSIIDTAYCAVGWSESIPAGTSAAVEYSSNGGSSYSTATNGSCPFTIASSLAAVSDFRIKVTLTTTDATSTPTITALGFIAGTTAGQTVRYQLNTTPALTATDRTGNGYSGTMSFPALPSGVSTTVGSMTALRAPPSAQTARGIPQITSPVTGTAVSDNIFNTDETGWTGLPGYQLVNTMATAGEGGGGGLPVQFIWYIMLGLVTIMLGFFALNLTQSLFAAGVAMALGLGASIAMGGGLIPGWVIFVFIPVAVGMIFLRPRLAI